MKPVIILASLLTLASLATAQDAKPIPLIKTTDGVELRDVTVKRIDAGGASIMHSDGSGRFEWSRFSKDDQKIMGFDIDKITSDRAAAMQKAQEKTAADVAASAAEVKMLQAEIAKEQANTLKLFMPKVKAAVASRKATVGVLGKYLIDAHTIFDETPDVEAIKIFGPPDAERKDTVGQMTKHWGRCRSLIWFQFAYNPTTQKPERMDLNLYENGKVALEPESGDGVIVK